MRDFFRGWKRKVGCVTLVLACAFMAGWVRSYVVVDVLWLEMGDKGRSLWSVKGKLELVPISMSDPFFDFTNRKNFFSMAISRFEQLEGLRSRILELVRENDTTIGHPGRQGFRIPYWFLVMPLTLLSARLLLSKPRAGKRQTELPSRTDS